MNTDKEVFYEGQHVLLREADARWKKQLKLYVICLGVVHWLAGAATVILLARSGLVLTCAK